jgi:hypothetical protein
MMDVTMPLALQREARVAMREAEQLLQQSTSGRDGHYTLSLLGESSYISVWRGSR